MLFKVQIGLDPAKNETVYPAQKNQIKAREKSIFVTDNFFIVGPEWQWSFEVPSFFITDMKSREMKLTSWA